MDFFDFLRKEKNILLNEEQVKAASFNKGNALVLATAGSGKTTVIVSRAGRLIYENLCESKILTITFSKMAAEDMKNRFSSIFDEKHLLKADFSTIHSFLYKIVQDYFRRKNQKLALVESNYKIIETILKKEYAKEYYNIVNDEEIENVVSKISFVKNMMIGYEDYQKYDIKIKNFKEIVMKYDEYKRSHNLMDFDDILHFGYRLLSQTSYYSEKIRKTYDFIQIDEMQDTSKIQHAIIKVISDDNLFMVGDDDQSIYSFRGSLPEYMLNFKKIYNSGEIFLLSNNFRSDGHIVSAASKLIKNNTKRYNKSIVAFSKKENEVKVVKMPNRAIQCNYLVDDLKQYENKTVGILYRNNISSLIVANALKERNIDFFIKEEKTKFFKSFVLYDVLSFLNLAMNNKDRESFSKIYYKSYTYFSKEMCNFVMKYKDETASVYSILRKFPGLEYYMQERIENFKYDVEKLTHVKPGMIINVIKNDLEYISYLEKLDDSGRNTLSSTVIILEILDEISKTCKDLEEFINKIYSLQDLLSECAKNRGSNVTLSSIHSSKGLEYDVVYLIDNIHDEFPQRRRKETDEEYLEILEEERRVFYVGLTRAKKILNIMAPHTPSIFIDELLRKK